MITVYNTPRSLTFIDRAMKGSDRVFFTRFGDNDIMQLTGTDLKNKPLMKPMGGNRTTWSKQLQKEMLHSFLINDPDFLKGLSGSYRKEPGMRAGLFAPFPYNKALEVKVKSVTNEQRFLNPVLFHYLICFKPHIFERFVKDNIRGRKILFIGSVDSEVAERVLGKIDCFVRTPTTDAYTKINLWYPYLEKVLKEKPEVIIPTCGQATRVIQGRMWNAGVRAHSIDMGSLFDALAGNPTRTWIKMMGAEIQQRYAETVN